VIESLGRELGRSDEATRLGDHPGTVQPIVKPTFQRSALCFLGRVLLVELKVGG
jgi:hypothetical protein